jgi:DNA-directed RNA polymerase specialized sigma24 family protein
MEKLYDDLFVHYLGEIVKSFNSSNATWKESYERYVERGFNLTLVSSCRGMDCVTDVRDNVPAGEDEIMDVHEALEQLALLDARLAKVVEMRYFGGLREAEIAEALGVNERTIRRDWEKARLLLAAALREQ